MGHLLFLLDTVSGAITASGAQVFKGMDVSILVFWERAVEMLFKDGFSLIEVELGLEVLGAFGVRGGIGATAGIGHGNIANVSDFFTRVAPVTFSTTVLLGLLGVGVNEAVFTEVLGEHLLLWRRVLVVVDTVAELVGASHDGLRWCTVGREDKWDVLRLL